MKRIKTQLTRLPVEYWQYCTITMKRIKTQHRNGYATEDGYCTITMKRIKTQLGIGVNANIDTAP